MNIVTYLFGENDFPNLTPNCKLVGKYVDLSTPALIKRFIKVYRGQVVPEGGYYCDGRHLLNSSVISTLMPSEYKRVFQELLRVMARTSVEFRVVIPKRIDDFINPSLTIKPVARVDKYINVVSRPISLFAEELPTYDAWELSIFTMFEAVFPEQVYKTTVGSVNPATEHSLVAFLNRLVKSPLELSNIMGVNSLRIDPVRNDVSRRLYIMYSFIDVHNHIWKIQMPGTMKRREQILDIIDGITYAGMAYDDLPPGMSDAALPWGLICVN